MFFIQLFLIFRPSFAPRFKHFKLVNHTSVMIGTRLPRNNLDFPRGVRLSSCSTGRSRASKESSFTLRNIKNNWRTYMRG
jgi:hypothetical protein